MQVIVPKLLGRNTGGILTRWFFGAGDPVKEGDQLYEVKLDKAATSKVAPASGTFRPLVSEGSFIKTGQVIAEIEES